MYIKYLGYGLLALALGGFGACRQLEPKLASVAVESYRPLVRARQILAQLNPSISLYDNAKIYYAEIRGEPKLLSCFVQLLGGAKAENERAFAAIILAMTHEKRFVPFMLSRLGDAKEPKELKLVVLHALDLLVYMNTRPDFDAPPSLVDIGRETNKWNRWWQANKDSKISEWLVRLLLEQREIYKQALEEENQPKAEFVSYLIQNIFTSLHFAGDVGILPDLFRILQANPDHPGWIEYYCLEHISYFAVYHVADLDQLLENESYLKREIDKAFIWWREQGGQRGDALVAAGFRKRGYNVSVLYSSQAVEPMMRALDDPAVLVVARALLVLNDITGKHYYYQDTDEQEDYQQAAQAARAKYAKWWRARLDEEQYRQKLQDGKY